LHIAVAVAAFGGICLLASLFTGYFIADHSSSDSSPSSLTAIGLAAVGLLAILVGTGLLGGVALARLRRVRRPPHGAPDSG
jgi:hypothetical protein